MALFTYPQTARRATLLRDTRQ